MHQIFISYRRDDARVMCDRIYDYLATVFGGSAVFRDLDALSGGLDFRQGLDHGLGSCKVALVVIGPRWVGATDAAGQRRLDVPTDFVRLEVEALLRRQIPVIPLLVEGAVPPQAPELPASLAPLAYRQVRPVRADPDFRRDMQAVVSDLVRYVPLVPAHVVRWRRLRNAFSRTVGALLSLATTLVVLNTVLNWFRLGLDLPLLTDLVHRVFAR
jgi:hypothetical protein